MLISGLMMILTSALVLFFIDNPSYNPCVEPVRLLFVRTGFIMLVIGAAFCVVGYLIERPL